MSMAVDRIDYELGSQLGHLFFPLIEQIKSFRLNFLPSTNCQKSGVYCGNFVHKVINQPSMDKKLSKVIKQRALDKGHFACSKILNLSANPMLWVLKIIRFF